MERQMENTPQKMPSMMLSQRLESEEQQEEMRELQIAQMVEQCFAAQDTYGKTPAQLRTLMKLMIEDLRQYGETDISKAFEVWRQEEEKIPTIAGIRKIIQANQAHKRLINKVYDSFPDSNPTPTDEEKATVTRLVARAMAAANSSDWKPPTENDVVPWFGLTFKQLMRNGYEEQLKAHLSELEAQQGKEAADDYLFWLRSLDKNK